MEEADKKKKDFDTERENYKKQLATIQDELKKNAGNDEKFSQLQTKLKELELKKSELEQKSDDLRVQEKKTPWNVDTISKPGFAKTIINTKSDKKSDEDLTEEEREEKMKNFVQDNKKQLEEYGMLRRYDDSKKFLLDHSHLAHEHTANYLVIWCINLQMEQKSKQKDFVQKKC